jgi:glyoxylate reductase
MATLLVTTRIPAAVLARLREACDVDYFDSSDPMPRDEVLRRLKGVRAVMCVLQNRLDAEALDAAGPSLALVANIAVGYDNVDVAAAGARGIVVTNTPDVLTEAVADFTIGLILSLTRRITEGDRLIRAGRWTGWALDFMLGTELRGRTLGIVGFGRIGRATAERACAFGMRILATTTPPGESAAPPPEHVRCLPLAELLPHCDVVSIHVPLNASTRHLIGMHQLALMKPTAVLVNTARGPVVDEAALAQALATGQLAGAALDVFEREPRVHEGLLALENVVLAPHLGSSTVETRTAMADLAARNVLAVLRGEPPLTPVTAGP